VRLAGNKTLKACEREAVQVLGVLAQHGNSDSDQASSAFSAGASILGVTATGGLPEKENWAGVLDTALPKLDRLKSSAKEKLVNTLVEVVLHDGRLAPTELELLRVICDLIHVPLPLLTVPRQISPQS
jgi:hypothetical protein